MTVKEAARELGRDVQSVYAYIRKGWLQHERRGHRIEISEPSLEEFKRGRREVRVVYRGGD